MRKILVLSLIVASLIMGGVAFATTEIQSGDNAVIVGGHMGPTGKTPPTEVIKVYVTAHGTLAADIPQGVLTAAADTGVGVGDVMKWDTTRADGYSVAVSTSDFLSSSPASAPFAGVMVTPCSRDTGTLTSPSGTGTNVGYMAIRGFCMAKVDTSNATTGEPLVMNGATLEASFGTSPTVATGGHSMSFDIGVLLTDTASDGLMKVVLR